MLHILELISLKIFDFHLLWTFLCPIFFLMWLMCLISYSSRRFHQRLFILNSSSSDNLYLFIPWDSLTAIIHSLFNCFLEFVSSLRSCQIELFEFCTRKKSSDFRLPSSILLVFKIFHQVDLRRTIRFDAHHSESQKQQNHKT